MKIGHWKLPQFSETLARCNTWDPLSELSTNAGFPPIGLIGLSFLDHTGEDWPLENTTVLRISESIARCNTRDPLSELSTNVVFPPIGLIGLSFLDHSGKDWPLRNSSNQRTGFFSG